MFFNVLNFEWHRTPFSNLEKTLRLPKIIKLSVILLLKRVLVIWLVFGLLVYIFHKSIIIALFLGFLLFLLFELFFLKHEYYKYILLKHFENARTARGIHKKVQTSVNNMELIEAINKLSGYSAWSLVHIVYMFINSWGWEFIFKMAYPLFVNTNVPYHSLLVGFNNKTIEADQYLWKLANERNKYKRLKMLEIYKIKYAKNRIDDLDLKFESLAENEKNLKVLIKLYKNTEAPYTRLKKSRKKREEATSQVVKNLHIPKTLFLKILKIVQENTILREDRRFYEFEFDYYIRQVLFILAINLNIPKNELFNYTWKELMYYAKDN